MKKRCQILAVAVMSLAMLAATGCSPKSAQAPKSISETAAKAATSTGIEADYPHSDTIRGLVGEADVIVVGDVLEGEKRDINVTLGPDRDKNPTVLPYFVATVKVRRVIKGNVSKGDVISVKQMIEGGWDGGRLKNKGSHGVLFLEAYGYGIPYSLYNPSQGALMFENGKTKAAQGNSLYGGQRNESDVLDELETLTR